VLRIALTAGNAYTAEIVDCYGKIALRRLYAYDVSESQNSYIEFESNKSALNNVYYTSGKVFVRYNRISASFPVIDVNINGVISSFVYDQNTNRVFRYNGYDIITVNELYAGNENYIEIIFHPYTTGLQSLKMEGMSIVFNVKFSYEGIEENEYNFVIDNRTPSVKIVNVFGEDKTDIIKSQYYNVSDNNLVDISSLFEIMPTKTLPETAIVSWTKLTFKDATNSDYYNMEIKLIKFSAFDQYEIIDLKNYTSNTFTITPKEEELGKYVVLYSLLSSDRQNVVYYKAYAFNISSTSTSLFEVRKLVGDVEVLSESYIKGNEIFNSLTNEYQESLKTKFYGNMLEADKNVALTRFKNMSVPVYICNQEMYVKVSGASVSYSIVEVEYLGASNYKMFVYMVSNNNYVTYLVLLQVTNKQTSDIFADANDFSFVENEKTDVVSLVSENSHVFTSLGRLEFHNFYRANIEDDSDYLPVIKKNKIYLEIYYRISNTEKEYLGRFDGEGQMVDGEYLDYNYIDFDKVGSYEIYVKDVAGNTRIWNEGTISQADHFVLTIMPAAVLNVTYYSEEEQRYITTAPIEYAYYNSPVTVSVGFVNYGFYDNNSVTMRAYHNLSSEEYITGEGGRKTNLISSFTFEKYGTYRVEIGASYNDVSVNRTYVFSIINPEEARIGLDFTTINNNNIKKVVNKTTGLDVTDIFKFLLNEAYIYSKLITYDRLSSNKAFGSTMGKQQFEVVYEIKESNLLPTRTNSFRFTINNQTPSLESSVAPGKTTTKKINIKFNPQTIYRQVGDCSLEVNGVSLYEINAVTAQHDDILTVSITEVGVYYVRLVNSDRVMASFKVTIKEPLNTWSIVLIVGAIIVVLGVIITFIIFRTKMKVR